nr:MULTISPECIES: S41 family peptidase [unclassified Herbaspirillum]
MKYVSKKFFKLFIVVVATLGEGMATERIHLQEDNEGTAWAMVARRDLAFMRQAIDSAHPAILDRSDTDFHAWLDDGYAQAQALAATASNERQALAALRFYAVGFRDGHLVVAPDPEHLGKISWAGWITQERDGDFFVAERARHWPVALPPVGAKILECDGLAVSTLVREHILPFTDRRIFLPSVRRKLAAHLTLEIPFEPLWKSKRSQSCLAEMPDGRHARFSMLWRKGDEGFRRAYGMLSHPQRLHAMGGGVYWINVSDFQLDQSGLAQLELLLEQIRQLDTADVVVLDTRGNNGGNSGIGDRILRALLKQDIPPEPEGVSASWRVSDIAINTLQAHVDRFRTLEGETGPDFRSISKLLAKMREAHARGLNWLEDEYTGALSEQGLPFRGRVGLVTDAFCASACLDFADAVLRIPGALHFGESTSADTNYLDVTQLHLPSGLMMWLPLKVYRGRARRSNEALVPHFIYAGDMDDTASLQRWVLEHMRK